MEPDWSYVEKRLKKEGFKKNFISDLKIHYSPSRFEETIELNILLFLKKSNYHGVQVTESAVRAIESFMNRNRAVLKKAEKDHGVSSSVIASLLWMESRHGANRGEFHVASAYLHLLQSEKPANVIHLQRKASKFAGGPVSAGAKIEIKKRTERKAKWALGELKALQTMHARDARLVNELKGSFAGAFGMPQFIPSSYVTWAKPYKRGTVPDLMEGEDAIFSVANYLSKNGWRRHQKKTYVKALMRYNNSQDYALAILEMARRTDSRL